MKSQDIHRAAELLRGLEQVRAMLQGIDADTLRSYALCRYSSVNGYLPMTKLTDVDIRQIGQILIDRYEIELRKLEVEF